MREYHILNLGAGVQSTTLYLMSMRGEVPRFDLAIFADTQEEPVAVYRHLEWLKSLGGPEIRTFTAGRLGEHLINGTNGTGGRCAAIPAFTTDGESVGRTRRQCSREYKVAVIERVIRRDVLGLQPRQRVPWKSVQIHQYFGISYDERSRASRIYELFLDKEGFACHFPLMERMWTRANCIDWLEAHGNVPHEVPRSACVFCPFHSDAEWARLKALDGPDWARAVEIDVALRTTGSVANRDMEQTMYVHRSCQPLTQIEFHPHENARELQLGFGVECEGVCGV